MPTFTTKLHTRKPENNSKMIFFVHYDFKEIGNI